MPDAPHLDSWAAELKSALRADTDVAGISVDAAHIEVTVWNERAAPRVWRNVDRLNVPEHLVTVQRLLAFLNPYPGDDTRNEAAFEEFLRTRVVTSADGTSALLTPVEPVAAVDSERLVLGAMPSAMSLQRHEYHADAGNRFWRLMHDILDIPPDAEYGDRVTALLGARVALWDVLMHSSRIGSLGRDVSAPTEAPNDLVQFLEQHEAVHTILLNGRKAERAFRRHIEPLLTDRLRQRVTRVSLPSTWPNTRVSYPVLLDVWRRHFNAAAADRE